MGKEANILAISEQANMDLGFSETQQMLKSSAREFLERECPHTLVRAMEEDERGYTPELWHQLAELGWLGLVFPEEYGGAGGDFLDLAVLLEEMGRALLPGPFFSTVVLGGLPLLYFGSTEQKQEFLPRIVCGQIIMTMAMTEPSATYEASGIEMEAQADGDRFRLEGTKLFVPDATAADFLLVPARTRRSSDPEEGITVFLVDRNASGLTIDLLHTVAADRQCEVVLNSVAVPVGMALGQIDKGWPVVKLTREWAAVGKCAEMVGNAEAILEMTLEYAKQRTQFGRPIGAFQAIQHHCANMATDVEGARYIMYQAAWKLAQGEAADLEASMAKAWVSEANRRVAVLGHQCHGAIGFTKEHNLQLYTRRAKAWELAYGDGDFHRELVAQQLGL